LVAAMAKKILRKFLVEKDEKGQQFLSFLKASFLCLFLTQKTDGKRQT